MNQAKGSTLEKAIARMDAQAILDWAAPRGEDGAFEALRALWSSDGLMEKRPSKKAAQRIPFLDDVAEGLASDHPEIAQKVRELPAMLTLVERGFTQVLARSKSFQGAKLPPMTQVSGALSFASAAQAKYQAMGLAQTSSGPAFELNSNFTVDGKVISPDTEMFGILKAATSTIMMMAYEHRWFNKADQIVLPELLARPAAAESEEVMPVLEYANVWHAWDRAQLRLRLGLGNPEYLDLPFPDSFPECIQSALRVFPDDEIELVDFIANDRLLARTRQHYAEMLQHESPGRAYPAPSQAVPLPPKGFVSFDEKLGLVTLEQATAFNPTQDQASYAGLRLVEWLRGYAVLKRVADEDNANARELHECPQFDEANLVETLGRSGLSTERARVFLNHVCLTKQRNDVYDRPVVKVAGDRCVLVAPALAAALLGPIVLSAIADAGAQIELKGKAFETRILNTVAGPGRQVRAFKTKRDGEEYDYDALLVWDDFCFLLECKNRSLSGGILQQVYRSGDEGHGHAQQVHRLVAGLMAHPDILDQHFPAARGKLLVPCVISALPYSAPGGIDGVLFGDYSMLSKFFTSPVVGQVGYRPGQRAQRQAGGEIFRLWAGDKPTPLDFLRNLLCSYQYVLTQQHTGVRPIVTGVFSEQEALYHGEYATIDPTLDSARAAAAHYAAKVPNLTLQDWEVRLKRLP